MKQFEYYEFIAILIPGVILLYGLSILFGGITLSLISSDISIGGFGLFFIIAFAIGHLVQALGNGLEWLYRKLRGGKATDWIRTEKHELIGKGQNKQVETKIKKYFFFPDFSFEVISEREWDTYVKRIYAEVARTGAAKRIDIFNGNYGLFRGMAASFITLMICLLIKGTNNLFLPALCLILTAISLIRMHRFGETYARELFANFLQIYPPANHLNLNNNTKVIKSLTNDV